VLSAGYRRTHPRDLYILEAASAHCLPGYLGGKEKQGLLPPSFTQLAITAIQARKDIPAIK
jgi:hypothetical protein